ncbi:MAG TPA: ABC transporter ATP-binding protein/permease [Candidatus Acutalibacter pullistercoris]|uniref:ABC transporter ATP-binding protein/permease n=1 Tax=Candidatus Acutalibacter pullistercoris TaxID=2838418 RepID=A0A9D1YF44_9FIRM|nr:ABC transporter ATP-binding protein/permease [Candidatus Acutalibacter pullistercoris]
MEQQGKKTSQWALLKRVLGYTLKQYQFCWLTVVVCIFITAMTTLVSNLFMQSLIDDYILPLAQAAAPDFGPLAGALLKLAAVLLVGILCSYAYNRIMVNVAQGTMKRLRVQLFQNMESLPIQYFDTHPHGDIMSVYTNDTDTLRQLISQSFPQLVNSAISLISAFLSMAVLDLPLTLVSLCMVGVMLLATMKLSGLSGRYFVEQQRDIGALNGYIEEMMEGQKVVKVFCHEERSIADFTMLNQKLRESTNRANAIANMSMPINANLGNISYVLCAVIGAALALGGVGGLTIGTLVAFLNLNKSFTQPVTQISQQVNSVVMATAGARRIFGLMDERPEKDQGYVTLVNVKQERDGSLTETAERTGLWAWRHPHQAEGTVTYTKLEGDVVFDGVDFGYTDEKMVLHDVKLHALPGQKIALVGSTGAGKTTITNLINRFYDIQDGKIRFDGINVTKIKKDDLRRSLGIVLQDTSLFTGTVMDNIRYGRLDAPDEECIAAAKLANADGFIRRLPQGYQTVLTGGGANLSQGQRQLLSIARAAVADPPVLILDEATSSIDTHTEKLVQRGMDALMTGRTSFVIAHRLSTVKDADCILVMEQGRVIERGSHQELLEQKGRYYQLYTGKTA